MLPAAACYPLQPCLLGLIVFVQDKVGQRRRESLMHGCRQARVQHGELSVSPCHPGETLWGLWKWHLGRSQKGK